MARLLRLASIGVLLAGVMMAVVDLQRPPAAQRLAGIAVGGIQFYQATLSPWVSASGFSCRFEPSCSRYAESVIRREGVLRGGMRAIRRVARCGPWTTMGTVDPP